MLKDLDAAARRLADFMSELSEAAYYAGWEDGLEYALWLAVVEGPREYGRLSITEAQIEQLRELAAACDGWIVFDDVTEETWVPAKEWEERFSRDLERMRSYCR